jgi:hypothetical protein
MQKIKLSGQSNTAFSQSPFSGGEQVFEWPAEWWLAECSLPPMTRASAEPWNAFLLALRGRSGTFYLGDSGARVPRGIASTYNLTRFPAAFENAVWNKNQCSVTGVNTITDPNAVVDADVVTPSGGATDAYVQQVVQAVPRKTFFANVWLKVPSGTKQFNLFVLAFNAAGTLTSSNRLLCNLTTSWQQFTVSTTLAATEVTAGIQIGGGNGITGTWTSGDIHMWLGSVSLVANPNLDFGLGPAVLGAGQTGKTLTVDGIGGNFVGVWLAGDYLQIGTGTTQRLHKILTDVNGDSSGHATIDIFPRLRESPADRTQVIWLNCTGNFRLQDNLRSWDIDEALIYGISFSAVEAI